MKSFHFSYCELNYDGEIMRVHYIGEHYIDLDEARLIINKADELTEGKPFLAISWGSMKGRMSKRARDFLARCIDNVIGSAIILNNSNTRLVANFFIRFSRPVFPTKCFDTEEEGMIWLKSLVNNNKKI